MLIDDSENPFFDTMKRIFNSLKNFKKVWDEFEGYESQIEARKILCKKLKLLALMSAPALSSNLNEKILKVYEEISPKSKTLKGIYQESIHLGDEKKIIELMKEVCLNLEIHFKRFVKKGGEFDFGYFEFG